MKSTREHLNAVYKAQGKPLPFPNDKIEGVVPEKPVQKPNLQGKSTTQKEVEDGKR